MDFRFKSKALYGGVEDVEGLGAVMAAASRIQTRNLQWSDYEGPTVKKDLDRHTLGAEEEVATSPYNSLSFDVLLAGSGEVGAPPPWGKVLRMCGHRETIDATVGSEQVVYDLVSGGYESGAFEMHLPVMSDPSKVEVHKAYGARGSISFSLEAGQLPLIKVSKMMGSWIEPVEAPFVASDTSAWKEAVAATKDNTPMLSLTPEGGSEVLLPFEKYEYDVNIDVVWDDKPGEKASKITDRSPSISLSIPKKRLGDFNIYDLVQSHNGVKTAALTVTHGVVDGNVIKFVHPRVQLGKPSIAEVKGETYYNIACTPLPTDAGDDETQILLPFAAG